MKKHLILLFLMGLFTFTSCSNDDDGKDDNSIVGTWTLVSVSPPLIDLNCPQPSVITFTGNGDADWELYAADNNCTLQDDSGSWEKGTGNNYVIYIPDYGAIPGTVNFTDANSFTFTATVQSFSVVLTFNRQI